MTEEITHTAIYTSCFDMPLYNFIQISLYGSPEKHGVNTEDWEKIIAEYSELSDDKSMSQVFNLTRQITYLTNRLNIIQLIIDELAKTRVEGLIELLRNDLGFNFKFDDFEGDIKRVVSRSKSDLVKLKLAQKQYAELQSAGGESVTEADWNDELAVLGKFQGYAIRQKETTVSEYIAVKRQLKKDIEHKIKTANVGK